MTDFHGSLCALLRSPRYYETVIWDYGSSLCSETNLILLILKNH